MAKLPTHEEMGEKVAEVALDEFIYKGKTIREWIDILAQTNCDVSDNGKMVDLDKYEDDICVQCGGLLTINDLFLCQKCSKVYDVKLIIMPKGGDI